MSGRRLVLEGTTASAAHEAGLLQLAADHFEYVAARTDFRPGVLLTENWESTSSRLIYALAATESATAVMENQSINIRGVTANPGAFASRLDFLRANLLTELPVDADVVVIESATSADQLCRQVFSQLIVAPISFNKSSTEIRTASLVALDRITEFARDCRNTTITITGHTDTSGDESGNQPLSVARAQAVADYISQNGTDPQRLRVAGRGSSEPIADNDTIQGRSLNRRIEFELN